MSITIPEINADNLSADDLYRAAGRADAYDDHTNRTIEQLDVLAAYIADYHPNRAYAEGYSAYIKGAQLEEQLASGRIEAAR